MMLPLQDASTGDIGECVHLDETKMQTMSLSVIGSLYEYVHDVAKAAKEKKSVSWAAPKVLIYTQTVKYVSDNLEFASERQELCQLKAKFQRSTKHKSRARDAAVADAAADDDADHDDE